MWLVRNQCFVGDRAAIGARRDRRAPTDGPVAAPRTDHPAIDDVEIDGPLLQLVGGQGQQLLPHLARREGRCRSGHRRHPRGEGAAAIGDAVGLAVDHA